jgi:uncharacterized membrane protein
MYRALGTVAGLSLIGYGWRRHDLPGNLLSGLGSAVLIRAVTNLPFKRLTGVGVGPDAIHVMKHIYIEAPPEQVFAFLRTPESFPQFMSHLRRVEPRDGYWHFVAAGPAGMPVSWNSEITELRQNELIAWRSLARSVVGTTGRIRLEPDGAGTRVEIHMFYNPPAGMIGHALASLFGVDPKQALDDDMLRLKSLLETGRATVHHHTVRKEEIIGSTAQQLQFGGL